MIARQIGFKFLAYCLLLCGVSSVQAADSNTASWYSIEYVIFKNNTSNVSTEELPVKDAFSLTDNARNLSSLLENKSFKTLTNHQLAGPSQRLNAVPEYTVITQGGWSQALKKGEELSPIIINSTLTNETLYGSITFHRGRFLHVDVDLQLSDANTAFPLEPRLLRLTQTRRFRTSQLHYFDHPHFGVLAKVEKLEPLK
ncbi:MAG: hypothetical protein A6F71_05140 [Cycloclasticus sp. symbiont of Poecilosclerida sp. M]|nr:MAG: hypothetical protein A6F71_05140 [Cycloclasticus sp. symbiont of Poecilosclerida sp. M]